MFTGIVQDLGVVDKIEKRSSRMRLIIKSSLERGDMRIGDSICVNGACLTMTVVNMPRFEADVSSETMKRTNLGKLRAGEKVNLELALRPIDRFGGHIVQGHVDGAGTIRGIRKAGEDLIMRISYPLPLRDLFVEKGSVALDGISLTVSNLGRGWIEVAFIPYTLKNTTISSWKVGDKVNIEADLLGKYLKKWYRKG
jgi:riboflavin synthase